MIPTSVSSQHPPPGVPERRPAPIGWTLLAALWALGLCGGLLAFADYQSNPGARRPAPDTFPADVALPRIPGRACLLLFVHPHCPCTWATRTELGEILSTAGDVADVFVLAVRPDDVPAGWEDTPLVAALATLPGVRVLTDDGGRLAHHFGAETSGDARFYDTRGRLRFVGGITEGRGHEGDNPGHDALDACLAEVASPQDGERTGDSPPSGEPPACSPVFGCALFRPAGPATEGAP